MTEIRNNDYPYTTGGYFRNIICMIQTFYFVKAVEFFQQ